MAEERTKFTNPRHEDDIEYAIQINREILKAIGLWRLIDEKNNIHVYYRSRIHILVCIILIAFVLVPGSLHTFITVKDSGERLKLIGLLSSIVMASLKYMTMLAKHREIGRCFEDLIDDWRKILNDEDRDVMHDFVTLGRYGSIVCACFMYFGGFFYEVLMPVLSGNVILISAKNVTYRPFPCPVYFALFNSQMSPNYEIIFLTQCLSFFIMHSTTIAACSLAIFFIMHACSQLEIITMWLDRLVDDNGQTNNSPDNCPSSRLAAVVAHHVRTLSFISRTERILRNICLVELLGCTLNLCLLGFDILMEWGHTGLFTMITYTMLIFSFTSNILLFCYIGEMLTEKCRIVGEKTYMINWHELSSRTSIGLILIMATADNPKTITAGKLTNLSLMTFGNVLKTSIGYLNILRALVL